MFEEDRRFVLCVLVQPDFADPQDVTGRKEFGDHRDHFARQRYVLGFLCIDAKPRVVLDAELSSTLGLELGELAEVIPKALDATAIEAGPESRFAHRNAPHSRQRFIVVGRARDHVDVGINVVHSVLAIEGCIGDSSKAVLASLSRLGHRAGF